MQPDIRSAQLTVWRYSRIPPSETRLARPQVWHSLLPDMLVRDTPCQTGSLALLFCLVVGQCIAINKIQN
ncbi:hypothetical protein [Desulfonema magnum]|uniref:hypothetical protein n=1 Tax=Desulfonema magnum TaxID=45655 RepID=UPI001A9A9C0C|nr:hypothetical protein [Desulfonema magnum]